MDLQLTAEHKMIQDMARDFAQKEIAPSSPIFWTVSAGKDAASSIWAAMGAISF